MCVDPGAEVGQLGRERERVGDVGRVLAGHAEDHVHVDPEPLGHPDPDRTAHLVHVVPPLGGGQHTVGAGLRADDDVVVGAVPPDQPQRLDGDVLRPDLGREAAEEDPAVGADLVPAGGEQLLDRAEVRLLAGRAVRQRGRRDEPDVPQATLA